ncbi:hypothetical protein EZV62_025395 [Acer yangbiense]|uniref:Uncharacterized protein n=1 Tax=Acer yangbiense TaxID=1000413 RepID=A0A5C7GXR2_9ROSI|nr:hypothetical protein EZV62_025395 [Acer yangbiense]
MVEHPIRFGIIGCAKIATKVARAINLAPNSRLYAVGSHSIDKAKSFAAINGLSDTVKLYGSYDQVLDDPCVDVVYLPLPTSLHVHWAVLAARKKKHLLLEKPTALDVTELDRILEACESNGVQFMDGSMWLHHPRTVKMKEMLFDSVMLLALLNIRICVAWHDMSIPNSKIYTACSVIGISLTKQHETVHNDHLSDKSRKEEGILFPSEENEESKAKTVNAPILATDRETDNVIQNVLESLQDQDPSKTSENKVEKSGKKTRRKRSSGAKSIPELQTEDENVSCKNVNLAIDGTRELEVDASSILTKKNLAKTSTEHQFGTGNIEGIVVDMPKGTSTCLNAKSFIGMKNLMLLKIRNVDLSEDLEYLPNKLQYLEWHECPLKNLPPKFQAQKLLELNLCCSQINYLWTGRKAFEELKTIKLSYSRNLIETPDFTRVPNLEMLDLEGCRILCKVHKSVGSLRLLTVLNLKNCENLESFPSNVDGLKALKILNLQGCSKLEKLPENLGELEYLEELDAGRTAITQVPPSIVGLTNLKMLSFCGHKVKHNQWGTLVTAISGFSSLVWPRRNRNFMGLSLPSLAGLFNLTKLDLSDCNLTDGALPNDLGSLCSLTELDLSNNYFVILPESINQLSKLKILRVQNCQNLKTLPELPSKLSFVRAGDCPLLEDLLSMLRGGTSPNFTLHLFNCFKLLENQGQQNNLAVMLLKRYLQQPVNRTSLFDIPLPGSEIPEWFSCRSNGNEVAIGLPDNWLNDEFMGIAMCGVFAPVPADLNNGFKRMSFGMSLMRNVHHFNFVIREGFTTVKSDLLWLIYVSRLRFENDYSYDTTSDEDSSDYNFASEIAPVSRSTCIHARFDPKSKVIKCGIRPVYKQDLEDFQELPATEGSTFHQNHSCSIPAQVKSGRDPWISYPWYSCRWLSFTLPNISRYYREEIYYDSEKGNQVSRRHEL